MDYIIFSAVWHSIISIAILIAMVKKKDIIDIMSYCCMYHVLTLCFVAQNSTNENITPDNFGILTFVYVIIGCLFYMVYCIIQEKKKQKEEKEEKEDYVSNKKEMDMKNKVINIVIILLCVFALYINYIDKYKMIGLLCIGMMGVLALCKNRGKEEIE